MQETQSHQEKVAEVVALAKQQEITLDPCLLREYPLGTLFWAVHHQAVCEPLTEPLLNRIKYILTKKPYGERKTRLYAIRPVLWLDQLPERIAKARAEYDKARAEYNKARAEYDKARAEYDKARAAYNKVLAEYNKAWAEYDKARAEYDKALAEYNKAWAECDKALAEYYKARDEYEDQLLSQWKQEYPHRPAWNKRTGLVFD